MNLNRTASASLKLDCYLGFDKSGSEIETPWRDVSQQLTLDWLPVEADRGQHHWPELGISPLPSQSVQFPSPLKQQVQ